MEASTKSIDSRKQQISSSRILKCVMYGSTANATCRVVLMFESESVEAAKEALATLPFVKLRLIDFDLIPLAPFNDLARLFQAAG